MKYCSNRCRSNAMQSAADQRGRRGRLATIGSMQCLFESSAPRVGIVVLKLEVPPIWLSPPLRIELLKWLELLWA